MATDTRVLTPAEMERRRRKGLGTPALPNAPQGAATPPRGGITPIRQPVTMNTTMAVPPARGGDPVTLPPQGAGPVLEPVTITRRAPRPTVPGADPGVVGPGADPRGLPTAGRGGDVLDDLITRFGQIPDFERIAPPGTGEGFMGGDFERARELLGGAAGVGGARVPDVDRVELARRALARFQEEREPDFERRLRTVGQRAAALGRTGAGMTTNDLTSVLQAEGDAERRFSEGVLDDALGSSIDDAFRAAASRQAAARLGLDASRGFADIGRTGFDEGFRRRTEGRGERDSEFARSLAELQAGQRLSDQAFDQDAFIRGERRDLSRQAVQDRIQELLLQDQLAGTGFDRELARLRLMAQLSGQDIGTGDVLNTFLA